MLHLLWIIPLLLLIVFISSPRFRGDIAESRVRRLLRTGLLLGLPLALLVAWNYPRIGRHGAPPEAPDADDS